MRVTSARRPGARVLTLRLVGIVALLAGLVVGAAPVAHAGVPRTQPAAPRYYLALGDSLATGVQYDPATNQTYVSAQGYVADLYARLHAQDPSLALANLSCPGETTTTMIHGGCPYAAETSYGTSRPQLAVAEAFLRAHRGQVALVTIDIGANDVDGCASATGVDLACTMDGLTAVATNISSIMSGLRAAGGWAVPIVGMSYYDPVLAAWLTGPAGRTVARESVWLSQVLNGVLWFGYALHGAAVAPVAEAFHTTDFTPVTVPGLPTGTPRNVATICALTWMCPYANIHANAAGYRVIAQAFAARLPAPWRRVAAAG